MAARDWVEPFCDDENKATLRRQLTAAAAFVQIAKNGASSAALCRSEAHLLDALTVRPEVQRSVNLHGPDVLPTVPEFTVANRIRRKGLHLIWAQPGGMKTHLLLHVTHALMLPGVPHLFEHPDLRILGRYRRVLWIATEEDAGLLRAKADRVLRGLDAERIEGEFRHLWASDPRRRITLDDLPSILDTEGPFDAIVLDSLTGLRPRVVNGERVRWDLDNDAANEACLALRGLASTHEVDLFLLHHTGRDTSRGYRGPTDWWASADVMFGLVPDAGRIRLVMEKNRDGRVLPPFHLKAEWGLETLTLTYAGQARKALSAATEKVDGFLRGRGRASLAEMKTGAGVSEASVKRAREQCVAAGLWRDTGESVNGSPVYEQVQDASPEGGS